MFCFSYACFTNLHFNTSFLCRDHDRRRLCLVQVDVRLLKEVIHKSIKVHLPVNDDADNDSARPGGTDQRQKVQLPFQDIISGLASSQQSSDSQKTAASSKHKSTSATTATTTGGNHDAAPFKDLSVHLCFICLLHLANEHGLQLSNHGQLDTLTVSNGTGGASAAF